MINCCLHCLGFTARIKTDGYKYTTIDILLQIIYYNCNYDIQDAYCIYVLLDELPNHLLHWRDDLDYLGSGEHVVLEEYLLSGGCHCKY